MTEELFSADFQAVPYWWQDTPRSSVDSVPLPDEVDVAVVGSGYTGLHAALQTARAGLTTLVLDSDPLGSGCSTRNGGQVSTSVKGSYSALSKKHGPRQALALLQAGTKALDFLGDFIRDEQLDCQWEGCGHFSGAHNTAAYAATARELSSLPPEAGIEWHMVGKSEQSQEIGSDRYHGGVVFPNHCALDPGRYHQGLLERVQAAGAITIGNCAVDRIEKAGSAFVLYTRRGAVRAGKVAVATNGYTGPLTPWMRRRIIPIGSYIIATEPFDPSLAQEISPNNRTMTDTRRLVFYYRLSPDRRRLLFGGRVALDETDPRESAPALHAAMRDIFPQLASMRISHSWLGFVGYTFDALPHIGEQDGLHYSMGYCGSGISLASHCGSIMGSRMCGHDRHSAFMDTTFKTRPFYSGRPWFLKPSIQYYKFRDR